MTQSLSHVVETFPHLRELDLADTGGEADINVLVGVDIYWELVTGRVVHGQSGPTTIETSFGWVLLGPADVGMESVVYLSTHTLHTFTHSLTTGTNLDTQLKKFWDLETLGIQRDEPSVYENFTEMITFKDGRYEVHLPWKEPRPPPEDHYQLSLNRLNSLLRRLRSTPELLREYNAVIQEQLAKGIIELVPESEVISQSHYIPHHAVLRHDKENTKLRIVYDASVKTEGPSLNDCLYVGPPFGQYILDIIIRFYVNNIALVGDIEKAFLMVSITKKDRDVLHFIWVDDPTKENPKVIILGFARVVFGVSASPFLLNATINHHIQRYGDHYPQLASQFMCSIYVDDVTFGSEDEEKTYELYWFSKEKLAEGGFNLRKFITNSPTLRTRIEENERLIDTNQSGGNRVSEEDQLYATNSLENLQLTVTNEERKILGVCWNHQSDCKRFP